MFDPNFIAAVLAGPIGVLPEFTMSPDQREAVLVARRPIADRYCALAGKGVSKPDAARQARAEWLTVHLKLPPLTRKQREDRALARRKGRRCATR